MSQEQHSSMPTMDPTDQVRLAAGDQRCAARPSLLLDAISEPLARMGGPTQVPPQEVMAATSGEDQGVSAWHNSKKVLALWSDHAQRNSYVALEGLGWKKFRDAHDSAVVSMTMLASVAHQTNTDLNVRIESDGMIHELYLW